jgi:hypothetical protein
VCGVSAVCVDNEMLGDDVRDGVEAFSSNRGWHVPQNCPTVAASTMNNHVKQCQISSKVDVNVDVEQQACKVEYIRYIDISTSELNK